MEEKIVEVVNRTMEPVTWMYDGREYTLAPLAERHMLLQQAEHAQRKTRYGFDAATGKYHYRLGIKGRTPCEPIEDQDHPDQWVDLLTKKAELSAKLVRKTISNPDLNVGALVDI